MTPEAPKTQTSQTVHVGNLRIAIHTADPLFASAIAARYEGFTDRARADFHIDLVRLPDRECDGSPYDLAMHLAGGQLRLSSPVLEATIDLRARVGEIGVVPAPNFGLDVYLENALRHICQPIAIAQGAFLLHAAGAVSPQGEAAQIFAGPSGAGKSTVSRLLRESGHTILSDDLVLVETRPDGCDVASTPFFGTLREESAPRQMKYPIQGINLLEKSGTASIEPLESRGAATAHIIANIPFTEALDQVHRQSLFDAVSQLVNMIRVRRLRFRRDLSFLSVIGWEAQCVSELELQS